MKGMLLEVITPLKSQLKQNKRMIFVLFQKTKFSPISVNTECGSWAGCEHWLVVVEFVAIEVVVVVVVLIPVIVHDTEDGHDVTGSEADIIISSSNEGVIGQEVRSQVEVGSKPFYHKRLDTKSLSTIFEYNGQIFDLTNDLQLCWPSSPKRLLHGYYFQVKFLCQI